MSYDHPAVMRAAESFGPAPALLATTSALTFWGLHISDIAVMLSALASICGVALQFYVTLRRLRKLEKASSEAVENSANADSPPK